MKRLDNRLMSRLEKFPDQPIQKCCRPNEPTRLQILVTQLNARDRRQSTERNNRTERKI